MLEGALEVVSSGRYRVIEGFWGGRQADQTAVVVSEEILDGRLAA